MPVAATAAAMASATERRLQDHQRDANQNREPQTRRDMSQRSGGHERTASHARRWSSAATASRPKPKASIRG